MNMGAPGGVVLSTHTIVFLPSEIVSLHHLLSQALAPDPALRVMKGLGADLYQYPPELSARVEK